VGGRQLLNQKPDNVRLFENKSQLYFAMYGAFDTLYNASARTRGGFLMGVIQHEKTLHHPLEKHFLDYLVRSGGWLAYWIYWGAYDECVVCVPKITRGFTASSRVTSPDFSFSNSSGDSPVFQIL